MPIRRLIARDERPADRVHPADLRTCAHLPSVHPGDVLRHNFLEPLGLSADALAQALHVPPTRIATILAGEHGVTAEIALRLARHFGTQPGFWLNLQNDFELEVAERADGERIRAEVAPRGMA